MPNPQLVLQAGSAAHVMVSATYVWLVGWAGAVFAMQVSYITTGIGLIWANVILGEAYAPTIWVVLAAMFMGMYLVQPRPKVALAVTPAIGETVR